MKHIFTTAIVNALTTVIYVAAVASFIFYGSQGKFGSNKTILIPIVMLLLFVFSAALTALLIFGRPALLYLDGKKKEALQLLTYTLGVFLALTLVAIFLLITYFSR